MISRDANSLKFPKMKTLANYEVETIQRDRYFVIAYNRMAKEERS